MEVLKVMDEPRDYVAGKFVGLVTYMDSFFGNDRNYQESNDSVLQLDLTRVMGYTGEHRFILQGKAKIHLPRAEKSLHVLLESDPDKNTANATSQVQANQPAATTATPTSYGAGLRYERQSADERWHVGTDGGLKFAGLSTAPFVRARGSYAVPLDNWRMKAAETVFWFNTTGPGETTRLTLSGPWPIRACFAPPAAPLGSTTGKASTCARISPCSRPWMSAPPCCTRRARSA